MILRGAGYEVGEAENGAVALAILSSTVVGAIVLDVRMPQVDGLQFLDAVPDPPPIVIVTSYAYDDTVKARRSKIFAFARKPVPPETLLDLAARALDSTRTGLNLTEYRITCVGRNTVVGGHFHITRVGSDFGKRGWEINRLVERLAVGDTFYVANSVGVKAFAFADRCECDFESIRTVEGKYQSFDQLDAMERCV